MNKLSECLKHIATVVIIAFSFISYSQINVSENTDYLKLQLDDHTWNLQKLQNTFKERNTEFSYQYLIEYAHNQNNKFTLKEDSCKYHRTQTVFDYDTYKEWKQPIYFKLDSLVYEECIDIINIYPKMRISLKDSLNQQYIIDGYKYAAINLKNELEQGYIVFGEMHDNNLKWLTKIKNYKTIVIEDLYYRQQIELRSKAIKLNLVLK